LINETLMVVVVAAVALTVTSSVSRWTVGSLIFLASDGDVSLLRHRHHHHASSS
jgi:hypothetical protein